LKGSHSQVDRLSAHAIESTVGSTRFAGSLAVLGGFLIVASGFAVHSFLLDVLDFLRGKVASYVPGIPGAIPILAIQTLAILVSLGGITVMGGGAAILAGRISTGRLLITIGGGAGFLGLLIAIGYSAMTVGPSSIVTHFEYWTGVILAVIARWSAKERKSRLDLIK
jgi:hypothetical protein